MTDINVELIAEIAQDLASIMRKNSAVAFSAAKLIGAMSPKQVEKIEKELEIFRALLTAVTEEQVQLSDKLTLLIDIEGSQEIH